MQQVIPNCGIPVSIDLHREELIGLHCNDGCLSMGLTGMDDLVSSGRRTIRDEMRKVPFGLVVRHLQAAPGIEHSSFAEVTQAEVDLVETGPGLWSHALDLQSHE